MAMIAAVAKLWLSVQVNDHLWPLNLHGSRYIVATVLVIHEFCRRCARCTLGVPPNILGGAWLCVTQNRLTHALLPRYLQFEIHSDQHGLTRINQNS